MKDKDLFKLLQDNCWTLKRINGSHHVLEKDGQIEVIAIHGKMFPLTYLTKY